MQHLVFGYQNQFDNLIAGRCDYDNDIQIAHFKAYQNSTNINVTINDDDEYENDEQFNLRIVASSVASVAVDPNLYPSFPGDTFFTNERSRAAVNIMDNEKGE